MTSAEGRTGDRNTSHAKQRANRETNHETKRETNQRIRTRMAIINACRELTRTGAEVTMREIAQQALVSEATAYRYFPDLVSVLASALEGLWPSPAEALAPLSESLDPVERIALAAEVFLRRVLSYQGAVRASISATITRRELAARRPGIRFAWIAYALAPAETVFAARDAAAFARLQRDLAVVVSPEALFTLTDLMDLSSDDAIATCVQLATTITAAALKGSDT